MDIEIIKAERRHFDDLLLLYYSFYAELRSKQGLSYGSIDDYREDIEGMFRRGDAIFLAYFENKPIGFVRISEREGSYWMEELYVDPEYRGKGIGRKLVKQAEKFISERDDYVYIMVLPQDKNAILFWMRMGYDLLNTIELTKDLRSISKSEDTHTIEVFGYPLRIYRWKVTNFSKLETEYLETLSKFFRRYSRDDFIRVVIKALKEALRGEEDM